MATESSMNSDGLKLVNGVASCNGGTSADKLVDLGNNCVKESDTQGVEFLEDFDTYWDDINDRLAISRMVSDAVIKGMVSAVEQEAAEKIGQKELEVARLKETCHLYHVGVDDNESLGSPMMPHEAKCAKYEVYSSISGALVEHDRIVESLSSLRNTTKDQLKKLRKDIDRVRGSGSIRKINSGSELVGLGGILQEKESERWIDVDKSFDSLRTTLNAVHKQAEDMVNLSRASLCTWQQEREFQEEIEEMVIKNCIQSLQEDVEQRLWNQSAQLCGNESGNWHEKIKEISSLRQELHAISKSLSSHESGLLNYHGSLEIGHRKVSENYVSSSSPVCEGNGKHDESIIAIPENLDVVQLKHLPKEALFNYFKAEMIKMKRHHESKVQEMTEDYFSLRREYLREKGSSLPLRKDKEFELLRKRIPEVVLKLDGILVENEKLPASSSNPESLDNLKDRLESLLSENRQLRDLLIDKKKEIKCLSSQISDAAEQMSKNALVKANLLKMITNLKGATEDAQIEASICEDVYICLFREMMGRIKSIGDDADMEFNIMQEIYEVIFREAAQNAELTRKCEFEDLDMEVILTQELCGVIYREAFREAEEKLSKLNMKSISESEIQISLERAVLEKERALVLEAAEKERLKRETLSLTAAVEKKEKLFQEAAAALAEQKEQFESVSQELENLRDQTSNQQILISESHKESDALKGNLNEALGQIELHKEEICVLNQKLGLVMRRLSEADEEKRMLLAVSQEKQATLSLVKAKEEEQRKKVESMIILIHGLSKAVADLECRLTEDTQRSNLRLQNLSSQLSSLIQKVNSLKRMGLLYKQRLERRCCDLQKAEAEVDLLGDEVDALLNLLEKIYIALDHYSPILQHYPGIIEILKLVRRELSGESTKSV